MTHRDEIENAWSALTVLACVILACLLLLFSLVWQASAQTVNPSRIQWDYAAAEHAKLSRYVVGYFLEGGSSPVQTVEVVPTECTPIAGGFEAVLPRPVFGRYQARMQACAGTACSAWSHTTDPFVLSPLTPAGVRILP